MSVAIKANRKTDSSEIESVECALGHQLPSDFKQFLIEYNGGVPESNIFDVPGAKTRAGVRAFFGIIGESKPGDILNEQRILKSRLPPGIIAVGEDDCGNRVCLSLRVDDFGSVFFWDHELESESDLGSALFRVVAGFSEFLSGLRRFDPKSVNFEASQAKIVRMNPEFARRFKLKPPR